MQEFNFNKTSLVIGTRQNIFKYYNMFIFNNYIIDLYNVLCLIYVMFIYLFIICEINVITKKTFEWKFEYLYILLLGN